MAATAAFFAFASDARAVGCDPFPRVPWWGTLTHGKVMRHVRVRYKGNWKAYIANFTEQQATLNRVRRSGGAVTLKRLDRRIEGAALDEYAGDVKTRIDILSCLAERAAERDAVRRRMRLGRAAR